jgi:acyl-homoserine-lactone acylase
MRGFADMLSPCYPSRVTGNTLKYKAEYGDTFIMLAEFGKNGVERLEALQPQGNSLDPKSPHYNDQMELFSKQQTRTVTLNKEKELKRAERVYHPQ